MDRHSRMVYVSTEVEIFLEWSDGSLWDMSVRPLLHEQVYIFGGVLAWLYHHVKETFQLTKEEQKDMINYTTRKIEFEVEVEYTEQADGFVKPTNATLQTQGCPNYVKAWIECEAMHQFTKEQEKVKI